MRDWPTKRIAYAQQRPQLGAHRNIKKPTKGVPIKKMRRVDFFNLDSDLKRTVFKGV